MIVATEDGKGIVWLASYPKSGNTWLRVFLYHLVRIQNGAPREADEINKLNRVTTYEGRLYRLFAEYLRKPVQAATVEEVMAVRPQVQAAIRDRSPTPALVKTHNALADIVGKPLINPAVTIGAIYMVRDPRDIAPSLAHHLGESIDDTIRYMGTPGFSTPNTADGPFEMWSSWSEHVASWTGEPNPALLVVRYEDLSADPMGVFGKVVQHMRQSVPETVIAEAVAASTFAELSAAEKLHPFRETSERAQHFFREGRVGAWRERLTPDQAKRVVDAHDEQMRRQGYSLD